jgi:hypothetical protein
MDRDDSNRFHRCIPMAEETPFAPSRKQWYNQQESGMSIYSQKEGP